MPPCESLFLAAAGSLKEGGRVARRRFVQAGGLLPVWFPSSGDGCLKEGGMSFHNIYSKKLARLEKIRLSI